MWNEKTSKQVHLHQNHFYIYQLLVAALTEENVENVRLLLGPEHKVDPNFFDSR